MKEHSDTTFNALVEVMRRNEAGTFIELVNNCDDLFGHDADGHSLMWHARQSQNPVFAETLDLLAAGKPFTEEAVQKQPSPPAPEPAPVPAAPEPAPVLSSAELEPLLHQLHESLLHGDILDDEEKKKLSNLPLAELCSYVTEHNLLHRAAEKGSLPICEQILKVGVPVDSLHTESEETALQWVLCRPCIQPHDLDACKFLLQHGASAAAKDKDGKTILHYVANRAIYEAAQNNTANVLEICKLLLKYGADPNAKDSYGKTPLHQAAESGMPVICEFLLAHGADMNAKDYDGASVLHWAAAANECADTIVFFLERGADVNARDFRGNTPLHYTIGGGDTILPTNRKGFQVLLAHGAARFAKNNDGKMAFFKHISIQSWPCLLVSVFVGAILGVVLAVYFWNLSGAGPLVFAAAFGALIGEWIGFAVAYLKGW